MGSATRYMLQRIMTIKFYIASVMTIKFFEVCFRWVSHIAHKRKTAKINTIVEKSS